MKDKFSACNFFSTYGLSRPSMKYLASHFVQKMLGSGYNINVMWLCIKWTHKIVRYAKYLF